MRSAAVVAVLLLAGAARADIFSPGDLSKAHKELEGLSNCTNCHAAGSQLSPAACLTCHTELKGRIARGEGFHGHIPDDKRACESCHHEHQGRGFELIDWGGPGKKGFDHHRTGWALEGAHAKASCESCHDVRLVMDKDVVALVQKHKRQTYLGLPTACVSCHFDEHRGQVSDKCQSCHSESSWKPARGFNHDKTDYPLKGKHRKVKCEECHASVTDERTPPDVFPRFKSESFMKFSPLPHASCLDCHEDPHDGRFGQRCQSCHTVDDWKIIKQGSKEREFHDKTRYPLRGEHEDVECRACHGPFPGRPAKFKGLPFDDCADCHLDAHLGQMSGPGGKGKPSDCEECHVVDGFAPPRFTVDRHKTTAYPLEGAHAAVSCLACHPRKSELEARISSAASLTLKRQKRKRLFSFALFQMPKGGARCESCHADVHARQFAKNPEGCEGCHKVDSFHALDFDHQRDSRFPLVGAHQQVACEGCHLPGKGGVVRYTPLETSCQSCHPDPHAGQFADGAKGTTCERCHDERAFKPAAKFDHQKHSRYVLDGKHLQVPCASCHFTPEVSGGAKVTRYRPLPLECEGCHHDYHEGAFRGFEP